MRCLVGARVSVLTGPQKVSQLAQIETGAKWVAQQGYEVVGTFEDLGVSATVPPEKRPDLGPWLDERRGDWDVIVWSKMDRAFRSTRHCVDFASWAETHRKTVVFAEDGLVLNYRDDAEKGIDSMMSELFVYLGSFFAQLELSRFQSRARDSHRMIRPTTRWASGAPPFGFRIIDHPSGKGKGLEQDPESQKVLHDMARKLLDGWSFTAIADSLGGSWTTTNVIEALTSLRTQGYKVRKRSGPVLDSDGELIRLAAPTFDDDTWSQIQVATAERRITRRRMHTNNPMLGVGFCGQCGKGLAQQFSTNKRVDGSENTSRFYRCSRTPKNCRNTMILADTLDTLLEEHFLEDHGSDSVVTRKWQEGSDNAAELEQVNATIQRLRREQDNGLIVTEEDEAEWTERMRGLVERRAALSSAETVSAGWVYESTGKTFQEMWSEPGADKRQMLIDRGVKLFVDSAKPFEWRVEVDASVYDKSPDR